MFHACAKVLYFWPQFWLQTVAWLYWKVTFFQDFQLGVLQSDWGYRQHWDPLGVCGLGCYKSAEGFNPSGDWKNPWLGWLRAISYIVCMLLLDPWIGVVRCCCDWKAVVDDLVKDNTLLHHCLDLRNKFVCSWFWKIYYIQRLKLKEDFRHFQRTARRTWKTFKRHWFFRACSLVHAFLMISKN
jgi:hypothetical protein